MKDKRENEDKKESSVAEPETLGPEPKTSSPEPEKSPTTPAAHRLFLDRIEGDIAVLLSTTGEEETELEVESDLLPADVREGDWLRVETGESGETVYRRDRDATAAAKSRVQDLLDELS